MFDFFSFMRSMFQSADKNGDGSLNFKEVVNLLERLNMSIDESHSEILFVVNILSFSMIKNMG